ncbi:MAG: hypothetical protein V9G14_16645 [Cypionkella sp.]
MTDARKIPTHEVTYARLRDMILFGVLEPGQPVTIQGLTAGLEVRDDAGARGDPTAGGRGGLAAAGQSAGGSSAVDGGGSGAGGLCALDH